jgi:putative phosphoesterase
MTTTNESARYDSDAASANVTATIVGILSDSHGQREWVRRALRILHERGATMFVHLGDLGDGVIDDLAGLPVRIVFGNCDDPNGLVEYARSLDIEVLHPAGCFDVDGKKIGITHGHLIDELHRLFEAGIDYLLHGHTHERSDTTLDGVRMINPGALHRARPRTVATLVPATGAVEWLEVA